MPAAVPILFGAVFTVAVMLATGKLILRAAALPLNAAEERVFGFMIGAAVLSTVVFLLCAARVVETGGFLLVGASILTGAWFSRKRQSPAKSAALWPPLWKRILAAGFAAYFVLYFFNAMAPEISPDGSAYHLGLVARYLRDHGFVRNTTNIYASMPGGAEMLFLFAFAFGGHSAAALVHLAFLCVLAWAMVLYGRRFAGMATAACGALLLFATPVVGIDAASAYNDVALACTLFGAFHLLEIWDSRGEQSVRIPLAAGLLAGFAFALKYTGAVAVLYVLGFLAWRSRRRRARVWPPVLAAGSAALAMILPWVLKNWLWVGNPFSPFANALFPNPFVHVLVEQEYARQLRDPGYYGLKSWTEIPWALTVKGSLTGILGPVYLLAPAAIGALRTPAGRRLLTAGLIFAAPYAANLGCRFLRPALPFLALGLASVVARVPVLAAALVAIHAWISWPDIINRYYPASNFHLRKVPVPQALRIRSEEQFLKANLDTYAHASLIERMVPPRAKVLSFEPVAEAYTSREVLVAYQSAFNEVARDILFSALNEEYAPRQQVEFQFQPQAFRRIRVIAASTKAGEPMCVHELRFFHGSTELPRAAAWRLRAEPNPWDVQMAFDNSPVTRWRSWQRSAAGMFVEADFGTEQPIERVRVERSGDQSGIELRLEGDGRPVAAGIDKKPVPAPPRLRRSATLELKARGIDYLLVRDGHEVAEDFWVNRAAWGITELGHAGAARLYRLD